MNAVLLAALVAACHDDGASTTDVAASPAFVSGQVSGLAAGNEVVLANDGGDRRTIGADGPFAFVNVAAGATFEVTALSTGLAQDCIVANGQGIASPATTGTIRVACATAIRNAFRPAADMNVARMNHLLRALPDGTALAIGGDDTMLGAAPLTIEQYDPQTDRWTRRVEIPGAGDVENAFVLSTGEVLVIRTDSLFQGIASFLVYQSVSSIYDPVTHSIRVEPFPPGVSGVSTSYQLDDGRVSGRTASGAVAFDPSTGHWTVVAAAILDGGGFVRLGDGRRIDFVGSKEVFDPVTARFASGTTRLYDPATGQFDLNPTAPDFVTNISLRTPSSSITPLPNGFALLVARQVVYDPGCRLVVSQVADVFDYRANAWLRLASGMPTPRDGYTATAFGNGTLFIGGQTVFPYTSTSPTYEACPSTPGGPYNVAEAFDARTNGWTRWKPMAVGRLDHAAVVLANGRLLVSGGTSLAVYPFAWLKSSELGY